MRKILYIAAFVLALLLAAALVYIIYDDSRVVNTGYTYWNEKIPESFDGFKISVVADFHDQDNYGKVTAAVKGASPDIICICGDLYSMISEDMTNSKELIKGLSQIAPVYYCYGNQEYYHAMEHDEKEPVGERVFKDLDMTFLNNKGTSIERNGELINLIGSKDSRFEDNTGLHEKDIEPFLKSMNSKRDKSVFSVLLSHRPQYLDLYSKYGYDLILSGHLHGGQVNIKYIREWILRKKSGTDEYCRGVYKMGKSTLIISGGIGSTHNFVRVFNTPEVVTVTLKRDR